jgi:hypothetical protein
LLLTDVFTRQTDLLQDTIERSEKLDHRLKVKYLTGLGNMVNDYLDGWRRRTMPPEEGVVLYAAFIEMMEADISKISIAPVVEKYPYAVGNILGANSSSVFLRIAYPDWINLFGNIASYILHRPCPNLKIIVRSLLQTAGSSLLHILIPISFMIMQLLPEPM